MYITGVADDGNRIALTPIDQYTDGYINASPIDVRTCNNNNYEHTEINECMK